MWLMTREGRGEGERFNSLLPRFINSNRLFHSTENSDERESPTQHRLTKPFDTRQY